MRFNSIAIASGVVVACIALNASAATPILRCEKPKASVFFLNGVNTSEKSARASAHQLAYELSGNGTASPFSETSLPRQEFYLLYNYSGVGSEQRIPPERPSKSGRLSAIVRELGYQAEKAAYGVQSKADEIVDKSADPAADFAEATELKFYEENYDLNEWTDTDRAFTRAEIIAGRARHLEDRIDHYNNNWKYAEQCLNKEMSKGDQASYTDCLSRPERHLAALEAILTNGRSGLVVGYSEGSIFAELYKKILLSEEEELFRNILVGTPVAGERSPSIVINHPDDPIGRIRSEGGKAVLSYPALSSEDWEKHSFGDNYLSTPSLLRRLLTGSARHYYWAANREADTDTEKVGVSAIAIGIYNNEYGFEWNGIDRRRMTGWLRHSWRQRPERQIQYFAPLRVRHQPLFGTVDDLMRDQIIAPDADRKWHVYDGQAVEEVETVDLTGKWLSCGRLLGVSNQINGNHEFRVRVPVDVMLPKIILNTSMMLPHHCENGAYGDWDVICQQGITKFVNRKELIGDFTLSFTVLDKPDEIIVLINDKIQDEGGSSSTLVQ